MTKPRKKYRPKPANVPLMVALKARPVDPDGLAMRLHAAILTLIERPSVESCNNLSEHICSLTIALSIKNGGGIPLHGVDAHAFRALQSAILAIEDVVSRYEVTGTIVVSAREAQTLRAAAAVLDPKVSMLPETLYQAAEKITSQRIKKFLTETT